MRKNRNKYIKTIVLDAESLKECKRITNLSEFCRKAIKNWAIVTYIICEYEDILKVDADSPEVQAQLKAYNDTHPNPKRNKACTPKSVRKRETW